MSLNTHTHTHTNTERREQNANGILLLAQWEFSPSPMREIATTCPLWHFPPNSNFYPFWSKWVSTTRAILAQMGEPVYPFVLTFPLWRFPARIPASTHSPWHFSPRETTNLNTHTKRKEKNTNWSLLLSIHFDILRLNPDSINSLWYFQLLSKLVSTTHAKHKWEFATSPMEKPVYPFALTSLS